jgi:hypothetical protein
VKQKADPHLQTSLDIPTLAMGCFNRVIVDGIACIDFYLTTNVFTHCAALNPVWMAPALDLTHHFPPPIHFVF